MLVIADKKIPPEAKAKLKSYGRILELNISGIVEEYIAGHPDLFFINIENNVVHSPDVPDFILSELKSYAIKPIMGSNKLSRKYPDCAAYNALYSNGTLIHKISITDKTILDLCGNYKKITVNQGMTRCSTIPLNKNNIITSDAGIHKILTKEGFNSLLVGTDGILLPGKEYGLFGGCCGCIGNQLFIIGSLTHYRDGEKVKSFAEGNGVEIVELYEGPLFDGGSLFMIQ